MKTEDIKEFEEKVKSLTIFEMQNKETIDELTKVIILLGDIFALVRTNRKRDFKMQQQLDNSRKEIKFLKNELQKTEEEKIELKKLQEGERQILKSI